jgi:hypothetical protein
MFSAALDDRYDSHPPSRLSPMLPTRADNRYVGRPDGIDPEHFCHRHRVDFAQGLLRLYDVIAMQNTGGHDDQVEFVV